MNFFKSSQNNSSEKGVLSKEIYEIIAKSARLIQANYERTSQFFLNSNLFIYYLDEMKIKSVDIGIIGSINLQCSGQSSFAPHKLAARFLENLEQIIQNNKDIKRVKIKLSGFDLSKELDIKGMNKKKPTLIEKLTQLLREKITILNSLEIRICNVKNCRAQDFKSIMALGLNTQSNDLSNISFEFSDWAFAKTSQDKEEDVIKIYEKKVKKVQHDRLYQPNIIDFMKMLDDSFEQTMGKPLMQVKKFRLQISTWYYTDYEVERFFQNLGEEAFKNLPKQDKIPLQIQYFHNEFRKKVENLMRQLMIEMNHMEIDLRNWNKKFEMGILKGTLLNIPSSRVNPLSQISKRVTLDPKRLTTAVVSKVQQSINLKNSDNKKNEKGNEEEDKPKELYFAVVV